MVRQQLPEKWCIKITEENIKTLSNWRTYGLLNHNLINGYLIDSFRNSKGYYVDSLKDYKSYEEITFEEFEIHVLKTKPLLSIIEMW